MIDTTGCYGHTQTSIETFSSIPFDLLNPQPGMVTKKDIAHHLAGMSRFTGALSVFYTVAEHCVHCHDLAVKAHGQGDIAFACLMHDAHEAYAGDDSRPKKKALDLLAPGLLEAFHEKIQDTIRQAFGIVWNDEIAAEVKRFDNIVCRAEAYRMMASAGETWGWGDTPLVVMDFMPWDAATAEGAFLDRFARYRG